MARVKGAMMTRKRRNKTLKLAKGYFGAKSRQAASSVPLPAVRAVPAGSTQSLHAMRFV